MSQIIRSHLARRLPLTRQRHFISSVSPRHISTSFALRNAEHPPLPSAEVCRACGAPLDSTEAGPVSPSGILRPEAWIIGGAALLTMTATYFFMPSSISSSGHAMQKRILDSRQAQERHEGDREEEETDFEKDEEAQMMKQAAREKRAKEAKTRG